MEYLDGRSYESRKLSEAWFGSSGGMKSDYIIHVHEPPVTSATTKLGVLSSHIDPQ